jgi:hypothetical protein
MQQPIAMQQPQIIWAAQPQMLPQPNQQQMQPNQQQMQPNQQQMQQASSIEKDSLQGPLEEVKIKKVGNALDIIKQSKTDSIGGVPDDLQPLPLDTRVMDEIEQAKARLLDKQRNSILSLTTNDEKDASKEKEEEEKGEHKNIKIETS